LFSLDNCGWLFGLILLLLFIFSSFFLLLLFVLLLLAFALFLRLVLLRLILALSNATLLLALSDATLFLLIFCQFMRGDGIGLSVVDLVVCDRLRCTFVSKRLSEDGVV